MKDEIAQIIERLEKLEKKVFADEIDIRPTLKRETDLDFSLNERAFIKKYSVGFSGQEFFTLILAYLAEGKEDVPTDIASIKKVWKSCAGIIGVPYASIFSTRAKDNGWINALKGARGSYVLDKHWQLILKKYEQNS